MAWNPSNDNPFWAFTQSMEQNNRTPGAGVGVDHANANSPDSFGTGFPFNPEAFQAWGGQGGWGPFGGWGGPWGGRGGHGHGHGRGHSHRRRGGRHGEDRAENSEEQHDHTEKDGSPETLIDAPPSPPSPPGPPGPPEHGDHPHPPPPPRFPGFGPGHHHRGPSCRGSRGRHGPGPHAHGPHEPRGPRGPHGPHEPRGPRGPHGPHDHHGPHGPSPEFSGPFDFRPIMHAFASHPFAQALRDYVEQNRANIPEERGNNEGRAEGSESFVPPVDLFNTERAYVLHVSVPGAVKEDVGVNWDPEKAQLNIAGVIYRPGDEAFLQSLTSSERKVGMFERSVALPPAGTDAKDEIDGYGITARMDNGILIVTVPKVEKEWTEVHKIDIE